MIITFNLEHYLPKMNRNRRFSLQEVVREIQLDSDSDIEDDDDIEEAEIDDLEELVHGVRVTMDDSNEPQPSTSDERLVICFYLKLSIFWLFLKGSLRQA